MNYSVTIFYQEPTYALHSDKELKTYKWTFSCTAETEEKAKEKALEEFRKYSILSGVSWQREVKSIKVELQK